jgi:hypothetical protein
MSNACYPPADEIAKAVGEFNSKFSCGEKQLWDSAQDAWKSLQSSRPDTAPLKTFVWTVKSKGSIQGVTPSDNDEVSKTLLSMKGELTKLKQKAFDPAQANRPVDLVQRLVDGMFDATKSEHYAWASKILHWLLPNHIPIYDSLVREKLKIGCVRRQAYRLIAQWEYDCARLLEPHEQQVVGQQEPKTLLRALDKYLWWEEKAVQKRRRRSTP